MTTQDEKKDTQAKDDQSKSDQAPPAPQPVTVVMQAEDRTAQAAKAMSDGIALQMDTTVAGGKYKVNDQWVNANGEPLKKD